MLREVFHFIRHVPGVARLARGRSQADIYEALVERADRAGIADYRRRLVADLAGRVLEIGCGTGRMFRHYPPDVELTAIEPEDTFRAKAQEVATTSRATIELTGDAGESLPFPAERFDAVVIASVLCSVDDVDRTLAEAVRVLKPTGELRLLEHVRSEKLIAGLLMDCVNPLWRLYNRQGCNLNRRLDPSLLRAGLRIKHDERFQIFVDGLPAFPSRLVHARPMRPPSA